ncbi:MAG: helix-turn-helix transcriptional regulator [Methylococcaceae bacterium]|jgi:transcriptional regulator with XRE-family HTH domain
MTTLAERIKSERKQYGLSQITLAKKAGISQTAISKLESGESSETRKISKIAAALGVNTEWLATGKGQKYIGQLKESSADYEFNSIEIFKPVTEHPAWKTITPQTRAFIEDILNKSRNGSLVPEFIKILQNMLDALIKS